MSLNAYLYTYVVLLVLAGLPLTAYPIIYAIWMREWFRSWVGRIIMGTAVGWAVTIDLTLLNFFAHFHGQLALAVLVFIGIDVVAWSQIVLLYKAHRERERERAKKEAKRNVAHNPPRS